MFQWPQNETYRKIKVQRLKKKIVYFSKTCVKEQRCLEVSRIQAFRSVAIVSITMQPKVLELQMCAILANFYVNLIRVSIRNFKLNPIECLVRPKIRFSEYSRNLKILVGIYTETELNKYVGSIKFN